MQKEKNTDNSSSSKEKLTLANGRRAAAVLWKGPKGVEQTYLSSGAWAAMRDRRLLSARGHPERLREEKKQGKSGWRRGRRKQRNSEKGQDAEDVRDITWATLICCVPAVRRVVPCNVAAAITPGCGTPAQVRHTFWSQSGHEVNVAAVNVLALAFSRLTTAALSWCPWAGT